ncbi:Sec1 family protein [Tritrichomonas foetus]|uniref:Sec1 family protein n=1 Tax=Tritrichomonas foetus TaxID=1144522 RepID=A0A1J4KEY2_9EUKA|nr:Sec1 family protein [Tritrichomonas foetus]|eukprot:OHT09496.1 Sec1 family protein [Tritrichomonas foetus]
MENTPKLQAGLTMQLFKSKANAALEDIVLQYPEPHILTFPNYLAFYVGALLDEKITSKIVQKIVPISGIGSSQERGTIFFFTTSDNSSINEILNLYQYIPNYTKVMLVIPRGTAQIQRAIAEKGYVVATQTNESNNNNDLKINNPSVQVAIYDFPADFLPIGTDFFLLPCFHSFYKLNIQSDFEDIYNSARALSKIESLFGHIPHVMCAGINAARVHQVLNQFNAGQKAQMKIPQIDSLIIIDRNVDLITPLTTEVNVEGFINAAFNIQYSSVIPKVMGMDDPIVLTEYNEVFRTIRMMPWHRMREYVTAVQGKIDERLESLKARQGEFTKDYAQLKSLQDMKPKIEKLFNLANEAIKKLKQDTPAFDEIYSSEFQLLQHHSCIDLAENLVLIYNDWRNALRLLCLEDACGERRSASDVAKIQNEISNEFGLENCLESFLNLEKTRFLSSSEFRVPLRGCLEKLDVMGPVDENNDPTDACGTALGGFVPPSVRFVQKFAEGETAWLSKNFSDKIYINESGQKPNREPGETRRIIVFFVGGVTSTEVGTIRNIGRSYYNGEIEFIVGSTDKISYNRFLDQICPFLENC